MPCSLETVGPVSRGAHGTLGISSHMLMFFENDGKTTQNAMVKMLPCLEMTQHGLKSAADGSQDRKEWRFVTLDDSRYHPVFIKHGLLENLLFIDVVPSYKPPQKFQGFSIAICDYPRIIQAFHDTRSWYTFPWYVHIAGSPRQLSSCSGTEGPAAKLFPSHWALQQLMFVRLFGRVEMEVTLGGKSGWRMMIDDKNEVWILLHCFVGPVLDLWDLEDLWYGIYGSWSLDQAQAKHCMCFFAIHLNLHQLSAGSCLRYSTYVCSPQLRWFVWRLSKVLRPPMDDFQAKSAMSEVQQCSSKNWKTTGFSAMIWPTGPVSIVT